MDLESIADTTWNVFDVAKFAFGNAFSQLIKAWNAPKYRNARVILVALLVVIVNWVFLRKKKNQRPKFDKRSRSDSLVKEKKALDELSQFIEEPGKFLRLTHGKTHYILKGDSNRPLVVLVHGFGMFSVVYEDLAETLLAHGKRVLMMDLYGHGYSDAPEDVIYDVDLFLQQMIELLHALELSETPFILVGHSMGGLISANFATRHPELIRQLILVCPAGIPVDDPYENMYSALIHLSARIGSSSAGQYAMNMLANVSGIVENLRNIGKFERNSSYDSLRQSSTKLNRVSSQTTLRGTGSRFSRMLDLCGRCFHFQKKYNPGFTYACNSTLQHLQLFGDWSPTFRAVDALPFPKLVLWGKRDEFIPFRAFVTYLAPALPSARIAIFEEADHFLFLNRPREFIDTVIEFIDSPSHIYFRSRKIDVTEPVREPQRNSQFIHNPHNPAPILPQFTNPPDLNRAFSLGPMNSLIPRTASEELLVSAAQREEKYLLLHQMQAMQKTLQETQLRLAELERTHGSTIEINRNNLAQSTAMERLTEMDESSEI